MTANFILVAVSNGTAHFPNIALDITEKFTFSVERLFAMMPSVGYRLIGL
jgi:hypothetical protein